MSIELLLKELVSSVEGATGAIVLAADGEAVGWHATDGERLRLRGAYLSVLLNSCVDSAIITTVGNLRGLVLEYDGARFVVRQINNDSFIAIELSGSANIAEAMFRLEPVVEHLRADLGS